MAQESMATRMLCVKDEIRRIASENVEAIGLALKRVGMQIDELAANEDAAGDAADRCNKLADLKAKHRLAIAVLDEFKTAGGENWSLFQASVETAWKDLMAAFRRLCVRAGSPESWQAGWMMRSGRFDSTRHSDWCVGG